MTHTNSGIQLRPFQNRFLRAAFAPDIETAALSIPRGNGKSTLSGHVLGRCMTPGDPWNVPGAEYLLMAASIKQARHVFRALKLELPGDDYRWRDSSMQLGVIHKPTETCVNVISSNAKSSFGIVGTPLCVCDEPGSWEVAGGGMMFDSLITAQGKPDSDLRVLMIGTVAPAMQGWWPRLIGTGSGPGVHVTALQCDDLEQWDSAAMIRRMNPLMWEFPKSRRKLFRERDEGYLDTTLKARFCSYRLNVPTLDETVVLLTAPDWRTVMARDMPPRKGPFAVGVDLGGGRAWSAAVAVWLNGRVEAMAVCPGIPSLDDQEKRDRVPKGTYTGLHEMGVLRISEGLRVQSPGQLINAARDEWGTPDALICDHFRLNELQDTNPPCPIIPRRGMWSMASEDIRGLRKLAQDGPLACGGPSAALIAASLSVATVQNDTSGNSRLVKSSNNCARDDVAAALLLAAGAVKRERDSGRTGSTGTGAIVVH